MSWTRVRIWFLARLANVADFATIFPDALKKGWQHASDLWTAAVLGVGTWCMWVTSEFALWAPFSYVLGVLVLLALARLTRPLIFPDLSRLTSPKDRIAAPKLGISERSNPAEDSTMSVSPEIIQAFERQLASVEAKSTETTEAKEILLAKLDDIKTKVNILVESQRHSLY